MSYSNNKQERRQKRAGSERWGCFWEKIGEGYGGKCNKKFVVWHSQKLTKHDKVKDSKKFEFTKQFELLSLVTQKY